MAKGKKKKKGGKKGKKKAPEPIQIVTRFDDMMEEELKDEYKTLEKQLEKSQVDRNFSQLERDMIAEFYDIIKKENNKIDLEISSKDREMEVMEDNHRVEVRVYVQKVKHLSFEHNNNTKRVNKDIKQLLKDESNGHGNRSTKLKVAKQQLLHEKKEKEVEFESEIKHLKAANEKKLLRMRAGFQKKLDEFRNRCEDRLKQLRTDLELRRKVEIHEIQERKNLHINDLMKNHSQAFGQIKNYYNDITNDNLKLIRSLKTAVYEMESNAVKHQTTMYKIAQENKELKEPLVQVVKEVGNLERELKDYDKDKLSLKHATSRLRLLETQKQTLLEEHGDLIKKFNATEREKDDLYESFESTVSAVKRKSDYKNLKLTKQLEDLSSDFNQKASQFNEVLTAANLDPTAFASVTNKLDDVLESRNKLIQDLQYAVARATKAHNDTIRTYENKLTELGIPKEEIGLKELPAGTSVGPAGLVVNNI